MILLTIIFAATQPAPKKTDVLEFIYAIVCQQDELVKPIWTGFNKLTSGHCTSPKSSINYLPVIQAPPSDYDVVNHILQRSVEEADKFGLENAVVVFDQAVYCKAQMVRLTNPVLQTRLVPCLGESHTVMTFLGAIGKRFADAGMREIIVELQFIALGSMKGVLTGHNCKRSISANKLLMESMYNLLMDQYVQTCKNASHVKSLSLELARKVTITDR